MTNDKLYYNYKKLEKESKQEKKENNNGVSYIYKFKIAIYCFVLFILLANKNTFKILDIIVKIFRKDTNDIIDDKGNPLIFGYTLLALIFALLILFIS
jgi:hypothetical protein